jgi:hypothetical protein
MDPDTVKHLELIQSVVGRMGSNSFAVKAWSVALIAAILALAAQKDGSPCLILAGLLPVIVFWYLDAFYLRQERLFRRLYDAVRTGDDVARRAGPFGMSTQDFEDEPDMRILTVGWSPTIRWLYLLLGAVVAVAFAVAFGLRGGMT